MGHGVYMTFCDHLLGWGDSKKNARNRR